MSRDSLGGKISLQLEDDKDAAGPGKGMHPVTTGVFLSLFNPYWSMWWATVGLLYITQALGGGLLGITSFYSGHILSDLIWFSLVSGAVAGGKRFISQKLYSGALAVCGLFVTGLGVYFIWDAAMALIK
jgi:threonine/homoserine/homoserine lactone efflux protein